jgi:hypothetical protein
MNPWRLQPASDDKTNSERALVLVARMQDGQERPQDARISVKRKKGAQSDEFGRSHF